MASSPNPSDDRPALPSQPAKAVRGILVAVALIFIGFAVKKLATEWDASTVSVDLAWVAVSSMPMLAATFFQALAWTLLIRSLGQYDVPLRPSIGIYAASYVARYVPFKVGMVAVRLAGAPTLGVSRVAIGSSILVEFLSWTVTGALVGSVPLFWSEASTSAVMNVVGQSAPIFVLGALAALGVLVTVDRSRLPKLLRGRDASDGRGPLVPRIVPVAHVLAWACWAAHGYCVTRAVGADAIPALASAGFYVLAPVAGFLAVFAPAGLGVREAILTLGLAVSVSPASAVAAALCARGVTLVTDVLFWLLTRVVPASGPPGND